MDFDLSWHRGAAEVSIARPETMNGYLAPEQISRSLGQSTRSALVDSFGLGMTLFYLRTGLHPQVMQHRHVNWKEDLLEQSRKHKCARWKSVSQRFFRLIHDATRHEQAARLDVGQIEGELQRLLEANKKPSHVNSAELLAEELANISTNIPYAWDRDRMLASIDFHNGIGIQIIGNETEREVRVELVRHETGAGQYSKITKWLPAAYNEATATLRRGGWEVMGGTKESYTLAVSARRPVNSLRHNLHEASDSIQRVLEIISPN